MFVPAASDPALRYVALLLGQYAFPLADLKPGWRSSSQRNSYLDPLTPSDMDHPKGLLNLCWLMILGVRLSNMLGTVIIIMRILFLTNHYFMEQHFGF
jgi:hypothetical protein